MTFMLTLKKCRAQASGEKGLLSCDRYIHTPDFNHWWGCSNGCNLQDVRRLIVVAG